MRGELTITGTLVDPEDEHEYDLYNELWREIARLSGDLPGWLWDATGLGEIADQVDSAIARYERKHG